MKKVNKVIAFIGIMGIISNTPVLSVSTIQQNEKYVYICQGPNSKKYHKTEKCRGLDRCSTKLKKVTEKEAKEKYKRTACKICYK